MPEFAFDSLPTKPEEKKPKTKILSMDSYKIKVETVDKDGKGSITNYEMEEGCQLCHREEFGSGESGGCIVCDGVMTKEEFEAFKLKYNKAEKPTLKPSEIKEKIKQKQETKIVETFETGKIISNKEAELIDSFENIITPPPNKEYTITAEIKKPQPNTLIPLSKTNTEKQKAQPKITKPKEEEFPIEIIDKIKPNELHLPPKQEVDAYLEMYKYVKKKIVDKSDFQAYKGKLAMKKSGWRKFIKPFNLSVEIMREEELKKPNPRVYESGKCQDGTPDVHAEVFVKVYITNIFCADCGKQIKGQSIESVGYKSKSEYWSEKYQNFSGYDLQNLITTARTRAENQGIADLVGFGEVSYEELKANADDNNVVDSFGGK